MRTQEEEDNGHTEQKLLGWCVLITIVNLFPHVEVIVGTGIKFEGNTSDPMKHQIRAEHVRDIGQGPRRLLGHTGDNVVEDLKARNEDDMNSPST
jgi:hypothetical protein